jgi:hypothetical protein
MEKEILEFTEENIDNNLEQLLQDYDIIHLMCCYTREELVLIMKAILEETN